MRITDSGFYVGDKVETPDGKIGHIKSVTVHNVNWQVNPEEYTAFSVVAVEMEDSHAQYWADLQLTRME